MRRSLPGRLVLETKSAFLDALLNGIVNGRLLPRVFRSRLWRYAGLDVHPSVTIEAKCFVGARTGLTIGAGSYLNYGCFFDLGAPTTIGANARFGYDVMLITCSHEIGDADDRAGEPRNKPIEIGDGCWLGARVMVLPGVTIGHGCVVAAGSVVTHDLAPHGLYAGHPAELKRRLVAA